MRLEKFNSDNWFVTAFRRLSLIATELPTLSENSGIAQNYIQEWKRLAEQAYLNANLFGLRLLLLKLRSLLNQFPQWEIIFLQFQGYVALTTSQNKPAQECFQKQYNLAKIRADKPAMGQALLGLAQSLIAQLEFDKAKVVLEKCLSTGEEFRNSREYTLIHLQSYNQLGRLYHLHKKWQIAEEYLTKALALLRQTHPNNQPLLAREEATVYRWLGVNQQPYRRWDIAENYLKISLDLSNQNRDVLGIVEANIQLGIVYYQKGYYDTAIICFEGGLAISEQLGYLPMLAQGYYHKARAYIALNKLADALELTQKSLEISLTLDHPESIALAYYCLGQIYKLSNKPSKAIEAYQNAVRGFNPDSYYPQWVELLAEVGDFLLDLPDKNGYWDIALDCYRRATKLVEQEEKLDYLATLLGKMGRAFTRIKGVEGLEDALRCYRLQLRLAGNLDSPNIPVAEAVALRVQAFMGMQRISALQGNRKVNPDANLIKTYYEAYKAENKDATLALG
jgi:tetratricopeptide (TPR) repeat protein